MNIFMESDFPVPSIKHYLEAIIFVDDDDAQDIEEFVIEAINTAEYALLSVNEWNEVKAVYHQYKILLTTSNYYAGLLND